jgi:hypothetical protein
METSFNYAKGHDERVEILRFLAALAIFICALHLMCMREARAALVRATGLTSVAIEPLIDPGLWTEPPAEPRYLVIGRA